MTVAEMSALARTLTADLDLGYFETRDDLIALLRERRAFQLDTLAQADPAVPTASKLALRASRWREIEICEAALVQMGMPLEAVNELLWEA